MKRLFPQVLQQLTSPSLSSSTQSVEKLGLVSKYFHQRKLKKQCKELWPQFSEDHILQQASQLFFKLKIALKQQDQLQLLKVCSIPLFEQYKAYIKHKNNANTNADADADTKSSNNINQKEPPLIKQIKSLSISDLKKKSYIVQFDSLELVSKEQYLNQSKSSQLESQSQQQKNEKNQYQQVPSLKSQWIRAYFKFTPEGIRNSQKTQKHCIERKIYHSQTYIHKKWYIHELNV